MAEGQHAMVPQDRVAQAQYLSSLASSSVKRYKITRELEDLNQAIMYTQRAIATTHYWHKDRSGFLAALGSHFMERYNRTSSREDYDRANTYADQAMAAIYSISSGLATHLTNLGISFTDTYMRTGSGTDLERAITYLQEGLRVTPENESHRAARLSNLGVCFGHRSRHTGSVVDLEQSITCLQEGLAATPSEHPDRAGNLNNLSTSFHDRYSRTGSINDLERAITYLQEALAATPSNHADRAGRLSNLGISFADRYRRTGSMADLEEAVNHLQHGLIATPNDRPGHAVHLANLGVCFTDRYMRTGSMDDLEQAITCLQKALEATPSNHPYRAGHLTILGTCFGDRYRRIGSMDDLEQAITYLQEGLAATPSDQRDRAGRLSNLGACSRDKYVRTGNMDDLERAITCLQQGLAAIPIDRPDRPGCQSNLGICFRDRYIRTGSINSLEQAVACLQEGLRATPGDHPDRAGLLNNLGTCFRDKYRRTEDEEDDKMSLQLFVEGVKCSRSLPIQRFVNGRNAIHILCRNRSWREAAAIAETLFTLLPYLCSRHLHRDDQQHALKQVSGLAADACSLSLKLDDPPQALQRVEFGRALILGYLVDSRSDTSMLAKAHTELAAEYDKLRFQAFGTTSMLENSIARDAVLQERRDASQLLEDCERRIREQPGFEHFLQPASVHELVRSATAGPIVIVNCTDISSDAIILLNSAIEVVPLPGMSTHLPRSVQHAFDRHRAVDHREYQRDVESDIPNQYDANLLSWLWWTCVSLVLQKVTEYNAKGTMEGFPRIWWIGTGAASSLPFHAAGNYGHGTRDSTDNCLSQCISSYTPSIKSLKHARNIASTASKHLPEDQSLVVVTMPTTPGYGALSGADLELEAVQSIMERRWTVKSLACPNASQVLEAMRGVNIAHFACHGFCDPADLMASHLLLQTENAGHKIVDRLTVSALLDENVQAHAWIAYLSACSTAEVKMQELADESLHLTSAFQMVGFAHVVGSLRPADDHICVQVAELFYSFLIDVQDSMDLNRAVPQALNYAVRQISKEHPSRPDLWAPFVHLGA